MMSPAIFMRNDVSIPPDDSEMMDEAPISDSKHKEISGKPLPPPPGGPIADVELYDHPNFAPGGAGNFWLLGMIGIAVGVLVLIVFWALMR